MEVLNLEDQDTLRHLVEGSNSPEIFVSEFQRENGDSDIEDEEVEFVPTQSRYVQSALRQPLEINEIDDEPADVPASTLWREGTTAPDQLQFTETSGLQMVMGDTTPLDFLKLMVNDEMVESIVRETNRYATQTLKTKQLSPKSCFRHWVHFTVPEMSVS